MYKKAISEINFHFFFEENRVISKKDNPKKETS